MIPEQLRELPQWVVHRAKVPYRADGSGDCASSTDPATWTSYRQALGESLDFDGVGFVFSPDDGLCGIDLDDCVAASGVLHEAAYSIVASVGGWVEFSPSGRGLHIITRAQLPRARRTKRTPWHGTLELYSEARYFRIGGNGRGEIRDSQAAVDAVVAYYFPEPTAKPSLARSRPLSDDDSVIVDKLLADDRMSRLWAGSCDDHAGDHSAADLALCAHLAFFTGGDVPRIDSLFRRSGLMRDKWDESRGDTTYGAITIRRAIEG